MNPWICPKCGGELEETSEDENLETFEFSVECPECDASFVLVFKAKDDKPWTCPDCGSDCSWDMDESLAFDDDGAEVDLYGSCDECGCEIVETYIFDHIIAEDDL